ncbi:MAG: glucose 1-dehydrogenase [Proteobacteria bacterium]|nr:glucose 1-dehydrogenase [Pseudomonadota bacterium]
MTLLLEDRVALVTGGASGIGRAAALAFAREGARVVASDVDEAGVKETASAAPDAIAAFAADTSDEEQVRALVAFALDRHGQLDVAFNNAGVMGPAGALHQLDLDSWRRCLDVNLTGVFLCMKHELPIMQRQGRGSIINTSSGAGVIGAPGLSAYCASKHGILGITKTAALENARTGVRINAICPGSTDTPMLRGAMATGPEVEKLILSSQPGGRLGTPEEIAETAVWLASDRASFVSGASIAVDGAAVAR